LVFAGSRVDGICRPPGVRRDLNLNCAQQNFPDTAERTPAGLGATLFGGAEFFGPLFLSQTEKKRLLWPFDFVKENQND